MSTISATGGSSSAWADLSASRAAARSQRQFNKADTDGNGSIDKTELQSLLDKVSAKTGTSLGNADDVMSKMDTDGNGTLSKDELSTGMKSLMPAPSSTMEFASQRADAGGQSADEMFAKLDSDSSGALSATELNKMLDTIAADATGSTSASDSSTSTTSDVAAKADAAVFKAMDTDGDGTISKAEFKAALKSAPAGPPPTDGPAPTSGTSAAPAAAAGGGGGAGGAGSATTTATDPLDTNGDGVVSAQERAAGELKDMIAKLSTALDRIESTGSTSSSDAASSTTAPTATTATTSTTSTTATTSSGSSASTSDSDSDSDGDGDAGGTRRAGHHGGGRALSQLTDIVKAAYASATASVSQGSQVSVAA